MVKSAGFLKKMKKIGNIIGQGASWVNNNIVKPLRPIVDTALDMTGFGAAKPILDVGSNWLDEHFGTKSNKQIQDFTKLTADFTLDTQRPSQNKKYDSLW